MGRLIQLFEEHQQSPWLDNIRRRWLLDGTLADYVERGVRGLTSNPSTFQAAIAHGDGYEDQLAELAARAADVEAAYWSLVAEDIRCALEVLAPVHERSEGVDGYVSVEVDPRLADDTQATLDAARVLHEQFASPNLYVKVPGTLAGVDAIRTLIGEGHSINVTLLFSLERYGQVIDAYLDGLEAYAGDLSTVSSVASFFVSRVDSEVDKRLDAIGTPDAAALRGRAAVANAQLAYELFCNRFSGPRWVALAARGARVQRPLWASTSTKDPSYPDTRYVDELIGPDTVNTLPDATLAAFDDHGTLARTVDADLSGARRTVDALTEIGIELHEVTTLLEVQGVQAFVTAFEDLLETLRDRLGAAAVPS